MTYDRAYSNITLNLMEYLGIRLGSTFQNPSKRLTIVRRACSPLNKAAFFSPCAFLIEKISFYFIYGLDVKGGFLRRLTSIFLWGFQDLNHIYLVLICPFELSHTYFNSFFFFLSRIKICR